MNPFLRIPTCIAIFLASAIGILRAEELDSTHRILGLFEPNRQEDFREAVKTMPGVQLLRLDFETTEATFRYDVAKLIADYDPKKMPTDEAIAKRLDDLLRPASQGSFSLNPPASIPKGRLEAVAIKVGILDCKGCRYAVYQAIAKLDGVDHATVTRDSVLTAWIDSAKTTREALEAALKKTGIELSAP